MSYPFGEDSSKGGIGMKRFTYSGSGFPAKWSLQISWYACKESCNVFEQYAQSRFSCLGNLGDLITRFFPSSEHHVHGF
jgi:hypothetical protein